jgi:ribose-phosphate pyrophosphokinase
VCGVAALAGCPYTVLRKIRRGDRDVELSLPDDLQALRGRTPVLLDDIIASAHTMAEAVQRLKAKGCAPPVCVGVHAVCAGNVDALLKAAGASRVVTCDTLPHPSNAIDVTSAVAEAVRTEVEGLQRLARRLGPTRQETAS